MKLKAVILFAMTTVIISPAIAECLSDGASSKEIKNCKILEKNGIDYIQWKAGFSNPPKQKLTRNYFNEIRYSHLAINNANVRN